MPQDFPKALPVHTVECFSKVNIDFSLPFTALLESVPQSEDVFDDYSSPVSEDCLFLA